MIQNHIFDGELGFRFESFEARRTPGGGERRIEDFFKAELLGIAGVVFHQAGGAAGLKRSEAVSSAAASTGPSGSKVRAVWPPKDSPVRG